MKSTLNSYGYTNSYIRVILRSYEYIHLYTPSLVSGLY